MRIKSGVWYRLAMGSFAIGLLYSMGIEGTCQTGGTVSDGAFITAMVLILLAILFMRLGFAAEVREAPPQDSQAAAHRQVRKP